MEFVYAYHTGGRAACPAARERFMIPAVEGGAMSADVAHPLAAELARSVAARNPPGTVLLLGVGSGRNIPTLLASGAVVEAIEADAARGRAVAARFAATPLRVTCAPYAGPYPAYGAFSGALSTHALLHGTRPEIAAAVAAVRAALAPGAALYATFGSTRDPRYGTGDRLAEHTYAPRAGAERGVPHTYFDEGDLRALLADFHVELLAERSATETAGRWAHPLEETQTIVHWFARAWHERPNRS